LKLIFGVLQQTPRDTVEVHKKIPEDRDLSIYGFISDMKPWNTVLY